MRLLHVAILRPARALPSVLSPPIGTQRAAYSAPAHAVSTLCLSAIPRGMVGLTRHESADVVEWLAESYTSLTLEEMNVFHSRCAAKMLPAGSSLESNMLHALGSGGGAAGPSVSPRATPQTGAGQTPAQGKESASESAGTPAAAKKQLEKTTFNVNLTSYPPENKVKLIKELRGVVSVSIQEAKGVIDKSPGLVAMSLGKEDAEKLKGLFEKHGAVVELL